MARSNIKTKAGRISAYGFACGYIEAVENGHKHVTIWAEHGAYHVRWPLDKVEVYRYWTREGNGWAAGEWTMVAEYRRCTLLSERTE